MSEEINVFHSKIYFTFNFARGLMNIKLVDSIATIIDSLSPEERELLELKIKLNKQKKENQKTTDKVKNTSLIKIYTEMQ